jgi:hypothetical protein
MKSFIVVCVVFCFCSFISITQAANVYFTFLPVDNAEVAYYEVTCTKADSTSPIKMTVAQPPNPTERIYVLFPDLDEKVKYIFTAKSCTKNNICGKSSNGLTLTTLTTTLEPPKNFRIKI